MLNFMREAGFWLIEGERGMWNWLTGWFLWCLYFMQIGYGRFELNFTRCGKFILGIKP